MREGHVEADGFRVRYLEAGSGDPLIVLHGGNGLRVSRSHELLAESRRVVLLEMPGFGDSPANERSRSAAELAATMAAAVSGLGIETFDLMGSSFGGLIALWLALAAPGRVRSLILCAPAAIRERAASPEEIQATLYVHPENRPAGPPPDPDVLARQRALVDRLIGDLRDPELESRMAELKMPVLVVMGTEDRVIRPELGRLYLERLPRGYLVLVYDAGHAVDADRPEAFAALAADFLARQDEFLTSVKPGAVFP